MHGGEDTARLWHNAIGTIGEMVPVRMARLSLVLWAAVVCSAGCSPHRPSSDHSSRQRVLCTTYPVWLLTREVVRGYGEVIADRLLPAQLGCPHEYVVTPADTRKLEQADALVANGLGLDDFAVDTFRKSHPAAPVIVATKGIQDLLASEGTDRHEDEHSGRAHNPHLFASPKQAARMVESIAAQLSTLAPRGKIVFERNASATSARLRQLGDEFAATVRRLRNKAIVTQHDVFGYLARDTGLRIVAVIRTHPGEDPSAAELLGTVRRARDGGAGAVFTEPQYPPSIGETIARELAIPAAVLDPIASGPEEPPLDYYDKVMRRNMRILRATLGAKQ